MEEEEKERVNDEFRFAEHAMSGAGGDVGGWGVDGLC